MIVDSPPAISFTDASILSTFVDGVILVVHGGAARALSSDAQATVARHRRKYFWGRAQQREDGIQEQLLLLGLLRLLRLG